MLRKLTQLNHTSSSLKLATGLSRTFTKGPETKPKIAIVGGGPVGLTLSNILKSANVPFDLFEKNKPHLNSLDGLVDQETFSNCSDSSPSPAAHYINMRSMEIFNSMFPQEITEQNLQEIDLGENREFSSKVYDEILDNSDDLENYRYYRYARRIGDLEIYRDE
jgi:NADPH-dependent 2,4-dienoyl-CoA reductase/sulfur reductase-like enzyme